jgi:hypothetical protein
VAPRRRVLRLRARRTLNGRPGRAARWQAQWRRCVGRADVILTAAAVGWLVVRFALFAVRRSR